MSQKYMAKSFPRNCFVKNYFVETISSKVLDYRLETNWIETKKLRNNCIDRMRWKNWLRTFRLQL